jgi:UTRA domain/Bacterial regulatory proteins, gntR family
MLPARRSLMSPPPLPRTKEDSPPNVSRTTLRRAIAGLIGEGVLGHRHGAGTFIRRTPPHVEQPLSRLTSFTEDMRLRGLAASSRVLEKGAFPPTPEEVMMLGIGPGESVFRLVRVGLADGAPMAIDRATVPLHFVERAHQVEDWLYAALEVAGFRPVCVRFNGCAPSSSAPPRRRCSKSRKAPPRSTSSASPISSTDGASSSPAPSTVLTRLIFVSELTLSPNSRRRTEGSTQ